MAKREKKPGPVDRPKDIGAALFLELMMQMLAFFILLTSMAVIVEEKRLAALGSLAGTFSPLAKGANLTKGKGPAMPARDIIEGSQAPKRTAKELTEVSKALGIDGMNVLPLDEDKVRVRLPERIAFASGHVDLSPASKPLMDKLAIIFSRPEVIEIRIEGHTDDKPMRSSLYPSNWELSAARAMSVFHALSERGVANGRMIVAGMGDKHPIANHPDLSRRVEITLKFRPVTVNPENKRGIRLSDGHRAAIARPQRGF
ncbi:MAG: flagellar motor protein MotB [Mariprofundaceae bacterium]|nr:flagellar motor protein MotB [Mariprofundaceae bacterium]